MSGQLMIPTADTQLHAVDTPGGMPPLLFLSGGFGTMQNWDHVIRRLAEKYRAVRFDARARGKSGTSADYSVGAAVDDIGRVIDATDIKRPILIGWSYGATIAVRYAAQHPEQVGGLVLVDGAYPITMFDEAGKEKVRKQFRRLGWMMRIMAALGRSARMSPWRRCWLITTRCCSPRVPRPTGVSAFRARTYPEAIPRRPSSGGTTAIPTTATSDSTLASTRWQWSVTAMSPWTSPAS